MALPTANLCINGVLRPAEGNRTYNNIGPWTGDIIGVAPDASANDVNEAIAAARHAFDHSDWSQRHDYRFELMKRYRDLLYASRDILVDLAQQEAGATLGAAAFALVDGALQGMDGLLECFPRVVWEEDRGVRNGYGFDSHRIIVYEPLGVVGAITPWNVPLYINIGKVVAALLAGCTVVLKPAPDTPLTATYMAELALEAGVPAGVFNVITSSDPALAGEILVADQRVNLISFTGSTATGKHIMEKSAATLKRVFLELGGKSVNIVLEDLPNFAEAIMSSMVVFHAGQGCAVPTRLLVPAARYDEAVSLLQMAYAGFADQWGKYDDPTCVMGPLISARQLERVKSYIDLGQAEGARLLAGGNIRSDIHSDMGGGFFIEPTCFVDVTPNMRIAQEEIFGPVLVVMPFADDDDAVAIANNSDYALGGMVVSANVERAQAIARRIHAGAVSVNGGLSIAGDLPFGGFKGSGMGREWGREGIEEFLDSKVIATRIA